jgi:hypothetical protein
MAVRIRDGEEESRNTSTNQDHLDRTLCEIEQTSDSAPAANSATPDKREGAR